MDYSDDDLLYYDSEDCGIVLFDADDDNMLPDDDEGDRPSPRKQSYSILSKADIQRIQEELTTEVSNNLSVSRDHACLILCHYDWDVRKAHAEWLADKDNVRKTVGLPEAPADDADIPTTIRCRLCLGMHPGKDMCAAACGHKFCCDCWRDYISKSINDGLGSLLLRCPNPCCAASVGPDMVELLVSSHDKQKYARYLLRSYVQGNKNIKWCPAPGCEFAVNFDMMSTKYDVYCKCGHGFCWNCGEEAHQPADCETVKKWMEKINSPESANLQWILANTKPCPQCKRAIEKDQGCLRMTCAHPCHYQFCWQCLGPWSSHRNSFYICNRFREAGKNGELDQEMQRVKRAKACAGRYARYWDNWAANHKSMTEALENLQNIQADQKLERLSAKLGMQEIELQFVIEAWEQIVESRRVLKWTHVYGYYLPVENKHARQMLLEGLQGQAEIVLEKLHKCAKMDLKAYFDSKDNVSGTPGKFNEYRSKLTELTCVTRNYFENLIRALENGLEEAKDDKSEEVSDHEDYEDHGDNCLCNGCTFLINPISSDWCEMLVFESGLEEVEGGLHEAKDYKNEEVVSDHEA